MNHTFDPDGFLDEIHFDEDLSAFSPGSESKMLDSPEPKRHQSAMSKHSAGSARWTDEEVSSSHYRHEALNGESIIS